MHLLKSSADVALLPEELAVAHVAGADDSTWLTVRPERAGAAVRIWVGTHSAFVDDVRIRGTARLLTFEGGAWSEQPCLASVIEGERVGSEIPVLLSALGPGATLDVGEGIVPRT